MSIAEQVKALEAQLAALKKAAAEASQAGVGDRVSFVFGRGENKTTHQGKIVGISEDGKRARIVFGSGFDMDIATVMRGVVEKLDTAPEPIDVEKPTLDEPKTDTAGTGAFEQQQADALAEAATNVETSLASAPADIADVDLSDLPL